MAKPDPLADSISSHAAHACETTAIEAVFAVPVKLIRPACFRTDERLRCHKTDCSWREDCRRLVAEWKR